VKMKVNEKHSLYAERKKVMGSLQADSAAFLVYSWFES
jgi:hypothetical protein